MKSSPLIAEEKSLCEPIGVKDFATIFALKIHSMVLACCFPPSLFAFSCVSLLWH
jgi:hypothetical protein